MEHNYTKSLEHNKNNAKYKYIAVLDLGSESMSAFFGTTDRTNFFQIDLQDKNNIKNWTTWNLNDVNILRDNNGEKSLRLRNKIVVNTGRGDYISNNNTHAKLKFDTDYDKSIFKFYQKKSDFNFTYLCNPKVIYAKGVDKILPVIKDSSGNPVELEPADYLKHLTAQIVNNFILNDQRIKDIPAKEIKLVITIPNVYSLTHAKELVDFLKNHTEYAEIDYVYESDAVVYASIVSNYHYFNNNNRGYLERKFRNINFLLTKKEPVNIISHDIGKGTSDLSFFQIYPDSKSDKYSINIKARTGLTKAGNALDYIFVNFMEEHILKSFYKSNNINFENAISLMQKRNLTEYQNEINANLQDVIYLLKKNIEKKKWWFWKKYQIPNDFYEEIKSYQGNNNPEETKTDADKFRNSLKNACVKIIEGTNSLKNIEPNIKNDDGSFNDDGKKLIKSLYDSFINELFKGNKIKNKQLTKNIDNYIEALGKNLPVILKHNAKEISINQQDQTFELDKDNTFVIISGQASQFKPLRKKIIEKYQSLFSIYKDNIILLEKNISKDICAIGGFVKQQVENQFNLVNPDDLLADYYLMNTAGVDSNPRLDYSKLNNGENIKVKKSGSPDLFLYSIINHNTDDIKEIVNTGSSSNERNNLNIEDFKSFIRGFTINGTFTIKYDKQCTCFLINNDIVQLGNKPQTNNHIYTNTWPEILK